ncbi:MAG: hypothetical protein NTW96_14370 [Planctomycetia bacterium]|nr:hypothetical protein [Planctomycetia bacterium]
MTTHRRRLSILLVLLLLAVPAAATMAQEPREVLPGVATSRIVQGEPYDLAGKRIVFLNWRYIRPGMDADWRLSDGRSARVAGSFGPWEARFRHENHAYGIRLVAQPAERMGPLVKLERPWESKGVRFNVVMQDDGKYRAWGYVDVGKKGTPPQFKPAYYESADGLHWERPNLGQVEFEGNRNNSLYDGYDEATVFKDPSAPPEERYKAVMPGAIDRKAFDEYRKKYPDANAWEPRALVHANGPDGKVWGIRGGVSPDGLRWTMLPEPLSVEYSDTQITAYYDPVLHKYVMYTRAWSVGPQSAKVPVDLGRWTDPGRRSIGRSETADFRHFGVSEMIYEPTPDMPPSDTLYTNCRTSIPGAPDQHVMFPAVWHQDDDTTTITMLSSSDGRVWQRVPGAAVLDTAPFGHWDGGCIFANPNLVELPDGSFALPYVGYNVPHKYARGQWEFLPGYAVWPKGRIVALEAPERGEFAMVALMPPGRKLLINAVTKRSGEIRVQVDGVDGRTLDDCDPIIGDQYRKEVTWKGNADLGHEDNKPIRLRFRMEKAQLFGLEFE